MSLPNTCMTLPGCQKPVCLFLLTNLLNDDTPYYPHSHVISLSVINSFLRARDCYISGFNASQRSLRYRYRRIKQHPSRNGSGWPNLVERKHCLVDNCRHCFVAGWNGLSGCQAGCNTNGWRWRYRSITRNPVCYSLSNLAEAAKCYRVCSRNRGVSGWNGWSACHVLCNTTGWRWRYRRISLNFVRAPPCPNLA
jgi:hypothetical protein